ncbi:site-2 protease family protein [Cohnella soli]|uniref:Site-2 protease family protein n=1 Tax=Cohnella soli TaxID=425005 RepID=A0ABW0HW58_9BACL
MEKNRSRSIWAGIGVFVVAKLKWALALLKWTKFGGTFITMMISLGAYAALYGWKFGVAIVYLIFVHEMGHLIAAKRKGVKTSPAYFIPFVGAMVNMKEPLKDAATESYVAYAGPLAGLISFLPAVVLYEYTGEPFWALVVFLGSLLNLFNLIPVTPLDGGRIVSVLSTKIWLIGLLILAAYAVYTMSPLIFLILIIGAFGWWNRGKESYRNGLLSYEKIKLETLREQISQWPSLTSTWDLKQAMQAQLTSAKERMGKENARFIPFWDDDKKLVREQAKLDEHYANQTLTLLQQWEHQPVMYEDGDPDRPIPSPLLTGVTQQCSERLKQIEEALSYNRAYYEAPAKLKWKVLIAYVLLAAVLSAFMIYGHNIMDARL